MNHRQPDEQFHIPLGTDIRDAIDYAIKYAKRARKSQVFTFTAGITVTVEVDSTSNPDLILRDYLRAAKGCIPPHVVPHPPAFLSDEDLASDARTEDQRRIAERFRIRTDMERIARIDTAVEAA